MKVFWFVIVLINVFGFWTVGFQLDALGINCDSPGCSGMDYEQKIEHENKKSKKVTPKKREFKNEVTPPSIHYGQGKY